MRFSGWSSDVCSSDLDCMADGRGAVQELRIEGINDRATLARAPGSRHPLRLSLRALDTGSRVQGLLDGCRLEIGRASGRENVCPHVQISAGPQQLKQKSTRW